MLFRVGIALLAAVTSASNGFAQVDQAHLAQVLLTGPLEERWEAVQAARRIPHDRRTPELWRAIFSEVARVQQDLRIRADARASGTPKKADHAGGEYYGDLLDVLRQSRDETAIELLVEAVGTGNMVLRALADFGEPAVDPLLLRGLREPRLLFDVLCAYALMLEGEPRQPLSQDSREKIVGLARERLVPTADPSVLAAAMEVGVAARARDLIEVVELIARDPVSFGIDPRLAETTRQDAYSALRKARGRDPL